MNRRDLLKAGAIMPFVPGILLPTKARAANFRATNFAHNNGSGTIIAAGAIPGMPSAATTGVISFNWKASSIGFAHVACGTRFITVGTCQGSSQAVDVSVNSTAMALNIFGALPSSCSGQKFTTATASFSALTSGLWYNFIATYNSANDTVQFRVQGSAVTPSITNFNGVPGDLNLARQTDVIGSGDITSVYGHFGGSYIPAGDIVDYFMDTSTGYAQRNATSGVDIIPGVATHMFLDGPPKLFLENLAARKSQIPPNIGDYTNWSDATDAKFTVAQGAIDYATSEPFDPAFLA